MISIVPWEARTITAVLGVYALYAALYLFRNSRVLGIELKAMTRRESQLHATMPMSVYQLLAIWVGVMMLFIAIVLIVLAVLGRRISPSAPW